MGSRRDKSSHDSLTLWTMLCLWPEYKGNWVSRNCPEIMTFPVDGRIGGIFYKKKGGRSVWFYRTNTTELFSCWGLKQDKWSSLRDQVHQYCLHKREGKLLTRLNCQQPPLLIQTGKKSLFPRKSDLQTTHTPPVSSESSPWANGAGARTGGVFSTAATLCKD